MAYLTGIWQLRHFWLAMVRNDLRHRYRRSILGLGWSLLHPMAMTGVLCFVFGHLFKLEIRVYAPFLLIGLTFWNFISSVMNQGCQCFFQNESYIRQHPAPLAIYPLRTTLSAGFHFVIGLLVATGVVWGMQGFGNLSTLPSLMPTLLLLFIFGWSLAVCAGMLNVLFQDSQHLIEIVLQILFYMTPVMYPPHLLRERNLEGIVSLNPLAVFLDLIRRPLLEGQPPAVSSLAIGALAALLTLGLAVLALRWFERRLIFYL